nr:carbohydrate ABC transporter permease [Vallitalea okinawensis]
MNQKEKINKLIIHTIIIIGGLTMLFPFAWMIITALKSYGESIMIPPTLFPQEIRLDNFQKAWNALPFIDLYTNTLLLIFWRVFFALVTSSMAGYAFGRIEFPGRNVLFSIVLIQMMLPPQIFIVPQYLMVAKLGWLNSITALVFPGLVSAFGTFLMRQFYKGIPKDIEEAAILDGCNHFTIFRKIMLPLSKNNLVALAIFTALFAYKELMWPLIANMSLEKMTLSSAIASLKGQYDTEFPVVMSASFIAMWPMLLLYIVFQKHFIQGIAFTGSKG